MQKNAKYPTKPRHPRHSTILLTSKHRQTDQPQPTDTAHDSKEQSKICQLPTKPRHPRHEIPTKTDRPYIFSLPAPGRAGEGSDNRRGK